MSHDAFPPGVGIERIWVLEATYAPDGAEARAPFRAEHLERMARLIREGSVIEAGAYLDVSTSIVLLRAETEEAALALARQDPYVRAGVWVELRVKPFGRVVVEPEGAGA
jgi:uncharacterized protein YciI